MQKRILIVDDEKNIQLVLSAILNAGGHFTECANNGYEALEHIQSDHFDLIITDLKMPKMDGLELLKSIQEDQPDIPLIMISAHGTVQEAVEAMKNGAFDYITKPFDKDHILETVEKALKAGMESRQHLPGQPTGEVEKMLNIVGASQEMKTILKQIKTLASLETTVLLYGETGTGKELLAKCLHQMSPKSKEPFIAVSCASLPPNLMESELFGHQKGSFTGAIETRPGRFELANGGTLFLDEISEIDLNIQVKLLRVLQEKQIERIGGVKTIDLDCRIVCATNKNLEDLVKEGKFREDLFYRINVVPINIPPLRDRRSDIIPLAKSFIEKISTKINRTIPDISPEAEILLENYNFPGNVRELENIIESTLVFLKGNIITPQYLPKYITGQDEIDDDNDEQTEDFKESVEKSVARLEKRLIIDALSKTDGNRTHAANMLGLSRRGLQFKIKKYNIT